MSEPGNSGFRYLLTKMENVVPAIIPPKRAMMISEVDISIYD
jgi:hypothetical protein